MVANINRNPLQSFLDIFTLVMPLSPGFKDWPDIGINAMPQKVCVNHLWLTDVDYGES